MNAALSLTTTSYPAAVDLALLGARLFLGLMIFAHGYQKFFRGGKIAGTAGWFESIGMKPGKLNAVAASTAEIGTGVLMTLGLLTPLASAGLIALMCVAIVTVHRKNGFFNFRKGQGIEYNLGVAVMALVPATVGAGKLLPRPRVAPVPLVLPDRSAGCDRRWRRGSGAATRGVLPAPQADRSVTAHHWPSNVD